MKKYFLLLLLYALSAVAHAQADSLFVTTSDSVRLFVKRSGKGVPVLFLHGGPGSNSTYFEKEGGRVFEKDVQLIYLDQRGCGRSDTTRNKDYSPARLVRDFEEVRQALGIGQWILMPHSFGGLLATEYAARHPEAIRAMVYLNCTVSLPASAASVIRKTIELLPELKPAEVAYLLNDSVPLTDRFGNAFWHLNDKGKRYALQFDRRESQELDDAVMNSGPRNFEMGQNVWRFPEYLQSHSLQTESINIPVLIISGTRDYAIGPDHPRLMLFPHRQVTYIPGGHALYLEHNKELYDAVRPFLLRYSSGTPSRQSR
ncbi:alpha/beta hydrolase [Paraflavisolibacter sp. H34]|uniref:alpha/beta fold hydrolase n=1 Tax=Huijunlia imazamoxiresistens TaxID=3127457 RepID=UPI00301A691A